MHIALCGPATLELLEPYLGSEPAKNVGYPFPLLPALADSLVKLGHRVTIVSTSPDLTETVNYRSEQLDLSLVPSRARARDRALDFFAVERRGIAEELRKIQPDVVHAHWTYEFALGALAAHTLPILVTTHDAPLTILRHLPDPYRLVRATMAYRARASIRQLTAVAPYLANQWKRQMAYRRPIAVIPNPIPALELLPGLRDTHPCVLSVSDASRRKNMRSLVSAFSAVRAARPDAVLRLVGPGLESTSALATWAREEMLADGVDFVGRLGRSQLSAEYAKATVFCHTSLEEAQPMVLLEALSAGLPVVAGAQSGGVPWTLFDGKAGRLVDVREPQAIAQAVIDAIDDPTTTVAKGFDVRAELQARYSPEAVAKKYVAEYERLLCEANSGNPA